ncbi:MAG: hypothetical protein INH41_15060 [Myxococcaceae bacterium]|nr:hypothetical protein [Myxococcaceae bacterium]
MIRQAEADAKFDLATDKQEWLEKLDTYGWHVSSEQWDATVASIGEEVYLSHDHA